VAELTKIGARTPRPFGRAPDRRQADAVEIGTARGMRARVLSYAATVQSLTLPDGADIALGYATLAPYIDVPVYVGAAIGRYANRIGGGAFTLDGQRYELVKSDGPNTLHGGAAGFDKVVWRFEPGDDPSRVALSYSSPDGEQGFPGAFEARVVYTLNEDNEFIVTFEARADKPTVAAMTHHGYFNLAGESAGRGVLDQVLTVAADAYTPVNAKLIPTGEIRSVAGTAFDFREPHRIGERIEAKEEQLAIAGGYDHNFVLREGRTSAPKFAARLEDPQSGRAMDILTTEPGLQFYSGNFLTGATTGKGGAPYVKHAGLCLEPQFFPDSPNQPNFPSARLDPGQIYRHVSIYRFTTR